MILQGTLLLILGSCLGWTPGPGDNSLEIVADSSRPGLDQIVVARTQGLTWYSARAQCQTYYLGDLGYMTSAENQVALRDSGNRMGCVGTWMGYTQSGDPHIEPSLTWCRLDGTCGSFFLNWASGRPDNCGNPNAGACDCALFDSAGEWNDQDCGNADFFMNCFLCETSSSCPDGMVKDLTSGECVLDCPASGRYLNTNLTQCVNAEECPRFANPLTGLCVSDCSDSEGLFADPISKLCTGVCYPGYYKNEETRLCTRCPVGSYTITGKETSCKECAQGYTSSDQSTGCQVCQPGQYSNGAGACISCPSGRGSPGDSASCYECPSGTYALPGTGCLDCPQGKYSDATGASECETCIESSPNSLLLPGASNLKECSSCVDGYYRTEMDNDTCAECSPGLYRNRNSSSPFKCEGCPAGRFGSDFGLKSENECAKCPEGKWSDGVGMQSEASCSSCPNSAGASCPEGSIRPFVYRGFFRDPGQPDLVLRCIPEEACLESGFSTETQCAEGYTGYLCSDCVPSRYYRKDQFCYKCGLQWVKWVSLMFVFCFLVVFVLIFSRFAASFASKVKISISGLQILASFSRMSDNFPIDVRRFLNSISLTNFDFTISYECDSTALDFWTMWNLKLFTPIIVAAVLLGVHSLNRLRPSSPEDLKNSLNKYIYVIISFVNFLYILIFTSLLEPFQCAKQDNGTYTMLSNPSSLCFDQNWRSRVLPTAITMGILYVFVLPVIVAYFFWKHRNNIQSEEFQSRYGSLTKSFKNEYFWYEFVVHMKRFSIIVLPDVLSALISENCRVLVCTTSLMFFLVIDSGCSPYKYKSLNNASITWSCIQIFLLVVSLVLDGSSTTSSESKFLSLALFVLVAFAVINTFYGYFSRVRRAVSHKNPRVDFALSQTPDPQGTILIP